MISKESLVLHYDALIAENNDPVLDCKELRDYMNKWDGVLFVKAVCSDFPEKVLEIGIGTGRVALKIAPLCKSLVGIDISPLTIERASRHLSQYKNVTTVCGDFEEYSFNTTFDVIYSTLTFMHIEDKEKCICKVFSLLNTNGKFVLSIDKNRDEYLCFGTRRLRIYPDNPRDTESFLLNAGFVVEDIIETELAYIFVAIKN